MNNNESSEPSHDWSVQINKYKQSFDPADIHQVCCFKLWVLNDKSQSCATARDSFSTNKNSNKRAVHPGILTLQYPKLHFMRSNRLYSLVSDFVQKFFFPIFKTLKEFFSHFSEDFSYGLPFQFQTIQNCQNDDRCHFDTGALLNLSQIFIFHLFFMKICDFY